MKKLGWQSIMQRVKRLLAFFLNPRLLLCFGIGWMITNGWCYLFIFFGARYGIRWMTAIGGAYAAFLWFPFTPEKIVTVAIAIFLLRLLFPHDQITLAVLQKELRNTKEAFVCMLARRKAKKAAKRMKRVMVIGCPGSGKSTFSRALHEVTGLPLVHLDRLYWRADKTTVSHVEFDKALQEAMQEKTWILDGNYLRTIKMRLLSADTVFFLDYPLEVCLCGIAERQGQTRSDMPWIEQEQDPALLDFVKAFPAEGRPKIMALLAQYPPKRVFIFHTREEAEQFLSACFDKEHRNHTVTDGSMI